MHGQDRKSESIKKFANTEDTEARECIPSQMSRKKEVHEADGNDGNFAARYL